MHGAGCGRGVWALQERRFDGALAPALPGHPGGEPLETADAYAEWLGTVVADVPPPRAVVGHGLGGAVALELALARPDLVDGLVLMASGPRLPVSDEALERARIDPMRELRRLGDAAFVAAGDDLVARTVEQMAEAAADALAADHAAARAFEAGDRLSDVRAPALVVVGQQDTVVPPELSEELARRLPIAQMTVIEAAGHLVMIEQASAVNLLLAGFLARLELTFDD